MRLLHSWALSRYEMLPTSSLMVLVMAPMVSLHVELLQTVDVRVSTSVVPVRVVGVVVRALLQVRATSST